MNGFWKVHDAGRGAGFKDTLWRPLWARKALTRPDDRERAEEFYRKRAEFQRQLRAAQAIARGSVR